MDLGLNGKVALVAGSSKGFGRTTVELLAQEGCRVAVVALERDQASIDDTVAAIRAAGGQAIGIGADFTVREHVERTVAAITSSIGAPDIAIANVDGPGPGTFEEITDDAMITALRDMTMSVVYLARAVLPEMRHRRWGRIIAINSVGAKEPETGRALVNPSRAAVVAFCKTLSDDVARDGITVNTVGTGWFRTDRMLNRYQQAADARGVPLGDVVSELAEKFPAKRLGEPSEMAATLSFLCSEGAGFITGEFINVDGGYHRSAF
jgi:3-oxoacyl-[acyl-carrier protein] reductase